MDLFALVARLSLDSSEYEKGIKSAEEGTSALSSKWSMLGKVAAGFGVAAVAAVSVAAVGIGKLTKKSVEAYANYEQLAGGVKKLYGDASDEVMKFANEAYKTSGMSANQYMEQATSFSAALVNSLNGDFSAAAKQTDVAMRAISDNFNTFGGDLSMIQGAFQGFAKQNYTMLDNLKLGYGGTKEEMQRLIADANEYAKSIGQAGDLSIDSFSDIVTAIDLVQQKQGIAGTTAKEAATTIEGSLNMTKAAWENLVAGFANPDADLGQLMDNLVVAIVGEGKGEGLLNQIIPAIQRAFDGIAKVIQKSAPILAEQFPALIQTILPALLSAAASLVAGLIKALPSLIATLLQQIPMLLQTITAAIDQMAAQLGTTVLNHVKKLITVAANGITSGISTVISAASNLVKSLSNAITNGINSVAQKVKGLAKKIPTGIKNGLGSLASAGRNLIEGLWGGIKAKFDSVIAKVKALAAKLPAAVKKVLGIASPSKVFRDQIGKNIVAGLVEGIENGIPEVENALNTLNDSLLDVGGIADTDVTVDMGDPFASVDGSNGVIGSGVTFNYEFNVYGSENQNPRELAEYIRKIIIQEEQRRKVAWA